MAKHTGIRKLPSGRYKARYFEGYDSDGKRRYPCKTFDLQSEAIKWRTKKLGEKHNGKRFEIHSLTVTEYLDQWLTIKAQRLRENSLAMYRQSLDTYVKPVIGNIRLSRLSPLHVERMQAELLARPTLSNSTVASARTILYGAMSRAVDMELIPINPVRSEAPKRTPAPRYDLTMDEAVRLVHTCAASRFGLAFRLALCTGLRPEELLGLTWPNLEIGERGVVHVKQVIHKLPGGGWKWHQPKSKHGIRSIVFPGELAARLAEHRIRQLEQKLKLGRYWKDFNLVFTTATGSPVHLWALTKEFKAALLRAGLPMKVRVYDMRHFFVTSSILAGVDTKTVSREAGHASVAFTLDHYGGVLEEMRESASDKREQLFTARASCVSNAH
jgi:integrase